MEELYKINRVEIIDHTKPVEEGGGRVYSKIDPKLKVSVSVQDDGRTLKIFLSK